jgi:hypothetical protein
VYVHPVQFVCIIVHRRIVCPYFQGYNHTVLVEIAPGWWIGGYPGLEYTPTAAHEAVTSVIDLTCDLPRWDLLTKQKRGLPAIQNYLCVPNWDGELDAQVQLCECLNKQIKVFLSVCRKSCSVCN